MAAVLFFVLIVIPVVELWIVVQVAHHIGIFETLGLLILISMAGALLLRQQGLATWSRLQETLARGEIPGREATDGFLVLLGGALLLTPGFLTDAIGLILLLPPTRALLKSTTRRILARWAGRRAGGMPKRVYTATVIRSGRREEGPNPPRLGESRPGSPPPSEDGSPGTG
jgi:UPF0716 protein FxsA